MPEIRIWASVGLLLAAVTAGCAAPPPRAAKAPVAAESPAPTPTPEPAQTPAPAPERDDQVVVLDPGGEEKSPTSSLVEAARAERERRAHAGPPVAVITDKNLKHYATGQVTIATPGKKVEAATPESEPGQPLRDEQYWRSRALEIRLRWRHAADDVKDLEKIAAGWRRRFYAERDPYVRDGQIKPEWDRVLDRLEEGRAEVEAAKKELAELLEEGRTAGALPGWLREGMDQEPKEEPPPSNTHEVIDPPRADQDGHWR